MKLSISNIAWEPRDDAHVADLLLESGVERIDVAPGKYFPEPACATASEVERVRAEWERRGIRIFGMQALLFGTTGLAVFGDPSSRAALVAHFEHVCRIASGLSATAIVFGSPRNRDRGTLGDSEVEAISRDLFSRLGDVASAHGVVLCLEPNPACYGANFMINSAETARVVRRIDHPAVRMQCDTGAMLINEEDAEAVLSECHALVGHVHLSDSQLVPLGASGLSHDEVARAVRKWLPQHTAAIEMVAVPDQPVADVLRPVLTFARKLYAGPSR